MRWGSIYLGSPTSSPGFTDQGLAADARRRQIYDNITNKTNFSESELHMINLFYRTVIVIVRYGTIYFRYGTVWHGMVPYGTCTVPQFDRCHKLALAGIELATRLNFYS